MSNFFNNLYPPVQIPSCLKWHGGKHYIAKDIVALMPAHKHYVEPYAGSLAVLLAKNPEGVSEVVNDLSKDLTNFWMQLRDNLSGIKQYLEATPFSEAEFNYPDLSTDPIHMAARFFIHCRQSLGGRMQSFAPLSKRRTRRGMNEQVSAWLTAIEGLPQVHARLKRVVIRCAPALDVIRQEDSADTLFYLDPPYLDSTRIAQEVYEHEMSYSDHVALLKTVQNLSGKVLISGYDSDLYNKVLRDWKRVEIKIPNQSSYNGTKRIMTEIVWIK